MIELIQEYKELAFWVTVGSILLFFVSLIFIHLFLVRIPPNHFIRNIDSKQQKEFKFRPFKLCLIILKNIVGIVLLLCGIAMLVLPGQGILTILISAMLIDFPARERFTYWLISRPIVLKTVNKIRKRAKRQPLNISIK